MLRGVHSSCAFLSRMRNKHALAKIPSHVATQVELYIYFVQGLFALITDLQIGCVR
jgi:hypothetical protein